MRANRETDEERAARWERGLIHAAKQTAKALIAKTEDAVEREAIQDRLRQYIQTKARP